MNNPNFFPKKTHTKPKSPLPLPTPNYYLYKTPTLSFQLIPYVHYIPSKTAKLQTTNEEVMTPLIDPAMEIIKRTGLKLKDRYELIRAAFGL